MAHGFDQYEEESRLNHLRNVPHDLSTLGQGQTPNMGSTTLQYVRTDRPTRTGPNRDTRGLEGEQRRTSMSPAAWAIRTTSRFAYSCRCAPTHLSIAISTAVGPVADFNARCARPAERPRRGPHHASKLRHIGPCLARLPQMTSRVVLTS